MILHLLSDDKFSDYAIDQFSRAAPRKNDFVVLVFGKDDCLKNIRNKDNVRVIREGSAQVDEICKHISGYNAVITHNLSTEAREKIIQAAFGKIKTAWVFWGFELYGRKKNEWKYLGPRSKFYQTLFKLKGNVKNFINKSYMADDLYEVGPHVFKNLDYCLTDLKEDYETAKSYFRSNFDFLWYNYYSIEETLGSLKNQHVNDQNILIGNSATLSNNHLEAFHVLNKLSINDRKIITPLSYGNNWYARIISRKGRALFQNHFHPLVRFIPREEYNQILRSCSVVIMNHYRHQGMGNIISAMWLGSRVYISKRTTTFAYFKRLGAHIFSVEDDLNSSNTKALSPLSHDMVMENREILFREYGKAHMLRKVDEIINELDN